MGRLKKIFAGTCLFFAFYSPFLWSLIFDILLAEAYGVNDFLGYSLIFVGINLALSLGSSLLSYFSLYIIYLLKIYPKLEQGKFLKAKKEIFNNIRNVISRKKKIEKEDISNIEGALSDEAQKIWIKTLQSLQIYNILEKKGD